MSRPDLEGRCQAGHYVVALHVAVQQQDFVAKPEPEFFTQAAHRIGADVGTVLFIDDNAPNIEGARAAGMLAEQWDITQGHDLLYEIFSKDGVGARG